MSDILRSKLICLLLTFGNAQRICYRCSDNMCDIITSETTTDTCWSGNSCGTVFTITSKRTIIDRICGNADISSDREMKDAEGICQEMYFLRAIEDGYYNAVVQCIMCMEDLCNDEYFYNQETTKEQRATHYDEEIDELDNTGRIFISKKMVILIVCFIICYFKYVSNI